MNDNTSPRTAPAPTPAPEGPARFVVVVARPYVSECYADGSLSPAGGVELHESVPGRYAVEFAVDPDGQGVALVDFPVTVLARITGPRWARRRRRIGQPSLSPVLWFAEEVQHDAVIDEDEHGPVAWFEREQATHSDHHTNA